MNQDYKELIEYLDKKFQKTAQKEDLNNLASKLVTLEEFDLFKKDTKEEFYILKQSIQELTNSIDKLVKAITDLKTEYTVITSQLDRHEKWIQMLAEKIGIKLDF